MSEEVPPPEQPREERETIRVLELFHRNIDKVIDEESIAAIVKELREKPYNRRQVRAIEAQIDIIQELERGVQHFKEREEDMAIPQKQSINAIKEAVNDNKYKALTRALAYRETKYKGTPKKGKLQPPSWETAEGGSNHPERPATELDPAVKEHIKELKEEEEEDDSEGTTEKH